MNSESKKPTEILENTPFKDTISRFNQLITKINFSDIKVGIDNVGRFGEKMLSRAWYSQDFSMLYTEAILAKTLAFAFPDKIDKILYFSDFLGLLGIITKKESILGDSINVGKHMRITRDHNRVTTKELSDGTIVKPGQRIGTIDIVRDLKVLKSDDNLISAVKELYGDTEEDLKELAALCMNNDPKLKDVEVFRGISHLAGPLAKKLGFDVKDIKNPIVKMYATLSGKIIVKQYAKNNEVWNNIPGKTPRNKFKSAREAYISRKKLVELYGDQDFVSLAL